MELNKDGFKVLARKENAEFFVNAIGVSIMFVIGYFVTVVIFCF